MSPGSDDRLALGDWPVAILAGGLATRLRPKTETIPKALLKVANQPFIVHQLALLRSAGFRRAVLCLGYLGQQIEDFLGDGTKFGMDLTYSFDGERLLGTGGALRRAKGLLGDRFVVLYGDSYLPIDYGAIVQAFVRERKPALMTVFKNDGRWDRSNVSFEAGQIRCYNKRVPTPNMHYIEYGIGVLSVQAFDWFADEEVVDLADIYAYLVANGKVTAYEVK